MTLDHLVRLNKIGKLKVEAPDQAEFTGLLESATRRLKDAAVKEVSDEGRFLSAYGAAHALSVAAMRWHGYRSSERYVAASFNAWNTLSAWTEASGGYWINAINSAI